MTLLEAYVAYCVLPDGADRTDYDVAGEIMDAATRALARRLTFRREMVDDAIQGVLLKLFIAPKNPRADDDGVRRLIYIALLNWCISQWRRERRTGQADGTEENYPGDLTVFPEAIESTVLNQLTEIAESLGGANRHGAIELVEMFAGTLTFQKVVDDILRHEGRAESDRKKIERRKYQQYRRARLALETAILYDRTLSMLDRERLLLAASLLQLSQLPS